MKPERLSQLTKHQEKVLRYVAMGYSDREVGRRLKITEKSVRMAMMRVYWTLDISGTNHTLSPRVIATALYRERNPTLEYAKYDRPDPIPKGPPPDKPPDSAGDLLPGPSQTAPGESND